MASKKYRVLTILVFLMAALLATSLLSPVTNATLSATPDEIRLTWSESPKTTQTIGWRTGTAVTAGQVQYAVYGTSTYYTVDADPPETLVTNIGAINLFTATVRNLTPGTKYKYRVGYGNKWSPYYTFSTEPQYPNDFEFLIFGDTHEKEPDYTVWQQTITQAYAQNPGAKFFVNIGDLIYAGKDYSQWQPWFAAASSVIANIPDMPAIGDHEPRGLTSDDEHERPEYFVKLFKVPQNGPANFKGEVYSYDYGYAHIAVLNSQFTYEFADPADVEAMIQAEAAWLDADLAATTKPWKIVIYHDATYNLNYDRAGAITKERFGPIIDKYHVDVVFNAHEHAMARSYAIRNEAFMPDARQGTVYFISGRAGNNAKAELGQKIWHPFFYDPQGQTCYLTVKVEDDELKVTTRLADGTVVDEFKIDKGDPAGSTPIVPFGGSYEDPRFVVFGTLLQFGMFPEQDENGQWYVDFKALAMMMNGTFDPVTNIFAYDEGDVQLQCDETMFLDPYTKDMISLEGLTQLGFHCYVNTETNMIFVERFRP